MTTHPSPAANTTVVPIQTRTKRMKTWSSLGNLGRKPNDYEIVTHNMNHTTSLAEPLEMGPEVNGNRWLKKHRNAIALRVEKLDKFRDPDKMTYRKYTQAMDEQETYVDGLLLQGSAGTGSDAHLSPQALDFLALVMTPTRYLGHGLQMVSAYVQQLAYSSYVGNCAAFQTADQLRRVQRVAYRTRELSLAHPSRTFGSQERSVWERDADWQPTRELVERLMVSYDWDKAFVGLNLVCKPLADELFLRAFAEQARHHGCHTDAMLADNLYLDAQRSRRWTVELCKALIEVDSGNQAVLMECLAAWRPLGDSMVDAASRLLTRHAATAQASAIAATCKSSWAVFLSECGLHTHA
jgi:Methane/Phenol/Toluene Hydroxylase